MIGYLDGAGLCDDPKGPLFRTIGCGTGKLTRTILPQSNTYAMTGRGWDQNQARQPQFSGDGDHHLSQERRRARKDYGDVEPCLDAHDAALRSPAR